jgi:hypothetical protein
MLREAMSNAYKPIGSIEGCFAQSLFEIRVI